MRTPLEDLFDSLISQGWADAQGGDVASPAGHYALFINRRRERDQILLTSDIPEAQELDPSEYLGAFLVVTDDQGFLWINKFKHPEQARKAFHAKEIEYQNWEEA
jgi:hypothetical protein